MQSSNPKVAIFLESIMLLTSVPGGEVLSQEEISSVSTSGALCRIIVETAERQ